MVPVVDTGAVPAIVVDYIPAVGMVARAAVPIVVAAPIEAADLTAVVKMVVDTES
jgi:hypothetical protein